MIIYIIITFLLNFKYQLLVNIRYNSEINFRIMQMIRILPLRRVVRRVAPRGQRRARPSQQWRNP